MKGTLPISVNMQRIKDIEYDEYGIAIYIDKYLDVIFTPEGESR